MSLNEWSEEKFRALTMHSADIISLLDANGRLLFNSEATRRVNGFTPEELVGKDTTEFIHPEDRPAVGRAFERLFAAPGATVRAQYRYLTKDGRWLWMEAVATNQLDNPAVGGIVAVSRDIGERLRAEAERKRFEQQLQQRQKLESLGLLAGSVAHDFNNLLSVILGEASLMRTGLTPDQAESVAAIESAAHQASRLTRRLLTFAGGSGGVLETVDLGELLRELEPLLVLALRPGLRLDLRVGGALRPVACDVGQVRQALLNLVQNASEAMPGGGTVSVHVDGDRLDEARLAACQLRGDLTVGDAVTIQVSDEGEGMSPETIQRVFDPFYSTKQAGRGLGLAAVSGTVHAHAASLEVRSTPGAGSTFLLSFAPTSAARVPTHASVRSAGHRFSGRALVVDDDVAVARTTARQLGLLGFEVEVDSGGEAALARVTTDPARFSLVVCDIRMPGLDGWETTRLLRLVAPSLPVLQVSGFAPDAGSRRVEPLTSFLSKPFTTETLAEKLRGLLLLAEGAARDG